MSFTEQLNRTYTKRINHANLTIGNDKVSNQFQANVKMRFWDEDDIYLEIPNKRGTPSLSNDILTLDFANEQYQWKVEGIDLKWLMILKSKPPKNTYSLNLGGNWQDFDFLYQTPFPNPETFIQDGEEWLRFADANGIHERPRKVDGSIAVYHKTKCNHIIGQTNYRVGKAGIIYAPKAMDAVGKSIWLAISVTNGLYTVTIPQSFLDSAVYPVVINDTFGYDTAGSSNTLHSANRQMVVGAANKTTYSPGSDGDAVSISLHCWTGSNLTFGLGSSTSVVLRDGGGITGANVKQDETDTLDSTYPISSASGYVFLFNSSAGVRYYWDSANNACDWQAETYSHGTLVDGEAPSGWSVDVLITMYCTFTTGGGEVTLQGESALTISTTGDLSVSKSLTGASIIAISTTADLSTGAKVTLQGSTDINVSTTGVLSVTKTLTGNSNVVISDSGNLTVDRELVGSSSVSISCIGDLSVGGVTTLKGQSDIGLITVASLSVQRQLIAATQIDISTQGQITVTVRVSGSSAVVISSTGTMSATKQLIGTSDVLASAVVSMTVLWSLQGQSAITIQTQASLGGAIKPSWMSGINVSHINSIVSRI